MCHCVETIRFHDGQFHPPVLRLHDERMNRTRRELFGQTASVQLADVLALWLMPQPLLGGGTVKCRVVYSPRGIETVEYYPYRTPEINTLLTVEDNSIEYSYKYCNRDRLNVLHDRAVAQGCDDALILRRGLVTDTTYCNVAFRLAAQRPATSPVWHTPAHPLLRGTMREYLLQKGAIAPLDITLADLKNDRYTDIALFNAMNDFGSLTMPLSAIQTNF